MESSDLDRVSFSRFADGAAGDTMIDLRYTPLERLKVTRPVSRLPYIVERCRGKSVLDLGCLDETALAKRGGPHWAHGEIARAARCVLGVDSSERIPPEGITTGATSRIVKGNVTDLRSLVPALPRDVEVVVAGELMEHLADTAAFLRQIRELFPGGELIATTPNATSLTNVLLAALRRESSHCDHLQIYSFKTLCTLGRRAGFEDWEIVPYHVAYAEMMLRSGPLVRSAIRSVEALVNGCEFLFPLLAGGLILHVPRM